MGERNQTGREGSGDRGGCRLHTKGDNVSISTYRYDSHRLRPLSAQYQQKAGVTLAGYGNTWAEGSTATTSC